MIVDIVVWILRIIGFVGAAYSLWNFLVSISSFGRLNPTRPRTTTIHRFAIVTCAKNEAAVISQLIGSLHRQAYPADAFTIFVTADNCTDDTAEICRQAGATVYERFDETRRGKGYALKWFFARFLPEHRDDYDAIVVFDADNVVHRDFLHAMNVQLNAGYKLSAGYRVGKNPSSSLVAGLSSMFWLLQSRYFYHPRARRGLPVCTVGGTGFMFSLDLLGPEGWDTHSTTEDIEFTLNAIAARHFAAYAPDAIFYDEQPLRFWQSVTQRYRWAVGAYQCMGLCTPRLWQSIRRGHRQAVDALIFSTGMFVTSLSGLAGFLALLVDAIHRGDYSMLLMSIVTFVLVGYFGIAFLCWLALELEDKSWIGDWGSILLFPFFALTWSIINTVGLFWRDSTWHDIPHTVNWAIEDVEHSVRIRQPDLEEQLRKTQEGGAPAVRPETAAPVVPDEQATPARPEERPGEAPA